MIHHFEPHLSILCEDCKSRFLKNPLRILDCKVDADQDCMKTAPIMEDYLDSESKNFFESVKEYLEALEIPYEVDSNLVRGLDYYTHTVFEVKAHVEGFGSQNVMCGGGRYNHLVETIGGPSTPGVGFAIGMERLLTALEYEKVELEEESGLDIYVIAMSDNEKPYVLGLVNTLRLNGFSVDTDYCNRNLKSNFKQADRNKAHFVILVGEEEVQSNCLTVKNNHSKEEEKIDALYIINYLDEKLGEVHEEI